MAKGRNENGAVPCVHDSAPRIARQSGGSYPTAQADPTRTRRNPLRRKSPFPRNGCTPECFVVLLASAPLSCLTLGRDYHTSPCASRGFLIFWQFALLFRAESRHFWKDFYQNRLGRSIFVQNFRIVRPHREGGDRHAEAPGRGTGAGGAQRIA